MFAFVTMTQYAGNDLSEWLSIAVAGGTGVLAAAIIGFLTFVGPYAIIVALGAVIGPFLLILDAHDGIGGRFLSSWNEVWHSRHPSSVSSRQCARSTRICDCVYDHIYVDL